MAGYIAVEDFCRECKSSCCIKCNPGFYQPEDFDDFFEIEKLMEACEAIPEWESSKPNCMSIRPRGVSDYLFQAPLKCIYFKDGYGCLLDPEARPFECRWLKPERDRKCWDASGLSNEELFEQWENSSYQEELRNLIKEKYPRYANKWFRDMTTVCFKNQPEIAASVISEWLEWCGESRSRLESLLGFLEYNQDRYENIKRWCEKVSSKLESSIEDDEYREYHTCSMSFSDIVYPPKK